MTAAPRPWRVAGLGAALAVTGLLAAACGGGGSRAPGSAPSSGHNFAAELDSFASCMRSHGDPSFYFTRQSGTPSPPTDGAVMDVDGYSVDVDPSSPAFETAQKACQHLAPFSLGPPHASHQQFLKELKSVECMRSHGYPNWPDPPHGLLVHVMPAGVDFTSPLYQAAAKACGEPAGPPGK